MTDPFSPAGTEEMLAELRVRNQNLPPPPLAVALQATWRAVGFTDLRNVVEAEDEKAAEKVLRSQSSYTAGWSGDTHGARTSKGYEVAYVLYGRARVVTWAMLVAVIRAGWSDDVARRWHVTADWWRLLHQHEPPGHYAPLPSDPDSRAWKDAHWQWHLAITGEMGDVQAVVYAAGYTAVVKDVVEQMSLFG